MAAVRGLNMVNRADGLKCPDRCFRFMANIHCTIELSKEDSHG